MKLKTLVGNGILAALYIAVTMLVQPFGFSQIQFRISEMFNHLVIYNKKYIFGMIIAVFVSNLLFSPAPALDIIFGVGHTTIALLIAIASARFIKNVWARMTVNTLFFTFTMFIIAFELKLALDFPFLATWGFLAISEFVVMAIGMPIIYALNKRINFAKRV